MGGLGLQQATYQNVTPSAPSDRLPSILDFEEQELAQRVEEMGQPRFRARQLWRAVYHECAESFDEMTALSRSFRAELQERFTINPLRPVLSLKSADGEVDKTLFRLQDGELIETVLMRYPADDHRRRRSTVCISTQAGCALGCTFCATGQQGFRRQLTSGEIVAQVVHMKRVVRQEAEEAIATRDARRDEISGLTNVVFMGMGEPLANYDNTMAAVRTLNHGQGVNIGARHMTISTVGLAPQIEALAREPYQINLAVSLHAPDDESRSRTMPINRRYPIPVLLEACREYVRLTNRRIFFEYVLLEGENDTAEHARKLARLLQGLLCHVNLIPVNPTGGGSYRRPSRTRSRLFRDILKEAGVPNTVRQEKGIDIDAGCGQLRSRALGDPRLSLSQA
ncbi:MAG: 23S rRNA (adenine(2503)-C(2))-methyltransferase RlmN [Chloroflexota bacterium]